jgi:hypothetical protein
MSLALISLSRICLPPSPEGSAPPQITKENTHIEFRITTTNTVHRSSCLHFESFLYPDACKLLRFCRQGASQELLTRRVEELILQADRIEELRKKAISFIHEEAGFSALTEWKAATNVEALVPNAIIRISCQTPLFKPCYHLLCMHKAHELTHQELKPTTKLRFLEQSALELAHFRTPFNRNEFLISHINLEIIFEESTHSKTTLDETASILQRCISDTVGHHDVLVQHVQLSELQGKVQTPEACLCGVCDRFFSIKIAQETRFLKYSKGTDPFQFLQPLEPK